ncbi:MFS transporter [Streptomyces sp. ID38640]|uniref:MFS transporter n=1 Tax=Streptomyces sp. ID38640 TaxID=1265399 RepID=UPI001ABF4FC3|nr:MFS transporter [Streptomyces sp. ID38640]
MAAPATSPPASANLRRIVAASLIGTTIEWYDFFLYGSAAALVFNKLFFPGSDPLVGTLLSFLTYAVGFAARPIGALVFGHYGDRLGRRIGRRPVYLLGAAGVGVWAFPFFALVDSNRFGLLLLAVSVGLVFHGAMYAPQAAFFAEMFATRMRYSGASIGAQFSSVAAGAPAPLIATALLADYDSPTPIALYVIAAALLTLLAVGMARETRSRDLAAVEGNAVEGGPVAGGGRTAGRDGGASSAVPSGGA